MNDPVWQPLVDQGAAVAVFVAFVSGLLRGWWILGREGTALLEQLWYERSEKEYWRERALRGDTTLDTAVQTAERATAKLTERRPTR